MSSDADVLFGKIAMQLGLLTKEQIDTAVSLQEMEVKPRPLGEILIEKRYITQDELRRILEKQKANLSKVDDVTLQKKEDVLFGKVAIREGLATADEVNECLREQAKIESDGSIKRLGELMVERGILSTSQVQRILERQKRRIMVCKGCKARYNVPSLDEGKPVKCPRCGGDVVLPTEMGGIQVDGGFDANATQVLSIVPQPSTSPAAAPPRAPAPARPISPPQQPAVARPIAPLQAPAVAPGTSALPVARAAPMTRRPTVVMKSPFAVGGAGAGAPAAPGPNAGAPAKPAQPQPAAGAPTKTPMGGVPVVRPDAGARTPTAVPPPKTAAATRTPTSVQRIMPAPGATSGIMRAAGGGGPKKVEAKCPICDHGFHADVDPSTGRVKCPQCKTSFSPH